MNQRLLVNLSRQDFGFAVARLLAIILWILSAGNLERMVALMVSESSYDGIMYLVIRRAPDFVYSVALAYGGYRIWIGADRFGGNASSNGQGDPMVVVSQTLLVCGLAMGVALYPLIHGLLGCLPYFVELVQSSDGRPQRSTSTESLASALLSVSIGAVVFGWAYRTASKVEVPEFEYAPDVS